MAHAQSADMIQEPEYNDVLVSDYRTTPNFGISVQKLTNNGMDRKARNNIAPSDRGNYKALLHWSG